MQLDLHLYTIWHRICDLPPERRGLVSLMGMHPVRISGQETPSSVGYLPTNHSESSDWLGWKQAFLSNYWAIGECIDTVHTVRNCSEHADIPPWRYGHRSIKLRTCGAILVSSKKTHFRFSMFAIVERTGGRGRNRHHHRTLSMDCRSYPRAPPHGHMGT